MDKNFGYYFLNFFKIIGDFFLKTGIGRIVGSLTAIIILLKTIGLWETIYNYLINSLQLLVRYLMVPIFGIPVYFWFLVLIAIIWAFTKSRYLKLVSGEFHDKFTNGLVKWEYGDEGWKVEYEDGKSLLSVSDSPDGGITKKGFSWNDYEFSFDTKIIEKNAGWIVRAENRSKYLMIQINLEDPQNPKLRLHLKIPGSIDYQWVVIKVDELEYADEIKLLTWIKVRILVLGSNIDVYLNGKHSAHYFIQDPIIIPSPLTGEIVEIQRENEKTEKVKLLRKFVPMNYSVGRVGFRCYPGEHAHFMNVRVSPKF